ncbi:hypothetical protein J7E73_15505 [Paenibacillus albidus]|uniref:CysS/YqeB C-terminal domain-containing protein n=1 Tax=Paenibacillus albidus TaxID=2041023 RepID=UPI001BE9A205|nr:hypothetical protein [Paenibacillus albidus]MBT2290513.1 hypothetical protein [Paenibacillus albidus]
MAKASFRPVILTVNLTGIDGHELFREPISSSSSRLASAFREHHFPWTEDARAFRQELDRLGIAVRDEGSRQYWRSFTAENQKLR